MKLKPVILFDGVCNLCNRTVNFVIKRDKPGKLQFAPLQSEKGRLYLKQFNLPVNDIKTFVLIEDGMAYTKSTAALKVCKHLNGVWPLCYAFIIVPKFIRDGMYNWIAKNRFKWFGVKQECMIPSPDIRSRFLN